MNKEEIIKYCLSLENTYKDTTNEKEAESAAQELKK